MRFWDSSALVPLVVEQPTSAQAEQWLAMDPEAVTWTMTPIEIIAALRRLVREGALPEHTAREAETVASDLLRHTHVVQDLETVKSHAARLLRVHPLRAADALQLGAAVTWSQGRAGGIVHTLDHRLALAAEREGFEVVPPP